MMKLGGTISNPYNYEFELVTTTLGLTQVASREPLRSLCVRRGAHFTCKRLLGKP